MYLTHLIRSLWNTRTRCTPGNMKSIQNGSHVMNQTMDPILVPLTLPWRTTCVLQNSYSSRCQAHYNARYVWKYKNINVRDVSFSIKRLKMSSCKKKTKKKKKKNRLTDTHGRTLQLQQHNKILFVYTVCRAHFIIGFNMFGCTELALLAAYF